MSKEISKIESYLGTEGSCCEEELFSMFPEGTRIFIEGGKVTFENLTGELLDVAEALNPEDSQLKKRRLQSSSFRGRAIQQSERNEV